jgi:hypothetical protein
MRKVGESMHRPIQHIRSNAVGYLALFVALGGTSYAAISIPRNSVGTPQLRSGAVTAKKLNARSIPGYVAFWARIDGAGQILASSVPTTTTGWSSGIGNVTFHGQLPRNCFPIANIGGGEGPGAHVSFAVSSSQGGSTSLSIAMITSTGAAGPESLDVVEICP